ncbi:NAD(P)/FAD-dependent oxidoreductase [Modestobacter sp. VKM Ac-2986]|uniref:NAD(P)/FAD-dependent oxidoreductase n=1 Tax=Modestobacter sp. VKM Ac-2986 TaxID=3004140 RepID=UPI0022AB2241|nr:NAD(P)/FAD-dependent oxidoreductase [Modestobacter sp. VKM Ac-2986]MCZ2828981.1 NAD(P)/FAD-dependent oxidoreductase [Modestobacter sp. VKM Ac-2986]
MALEQRYDVVVVGGGAAGLSGALALARARRSVLVVDVGDPRNAPAEHVHNVLGREGTPPAELLATGRREVAGYGGTVARGRVAALTREDDGVRVDLADGRSVRARRLLVATGLTDELPDVPGVAELWGRSVLHCPYCHGWEVRDRAIGVLGSGPQSAVLALLWRQWSADVVLFPHTGGGPPPEQREQLAARGVRVVEGVVASLDVAAGTLAGVRLASGEVVAREALVVAPRFTANAGVLAGLGIEPVDQVVHGAVRGTRVATDPTGLAAPGVWVAGNLADVTAQVMASAAQGMAAATAINVDPVVEDARTAVERARSWVEEAS